MRLGLNVSDVAEKIIRLELEKVAASGYEAILKRQQRAPRLDYEVKQDGKTYQVSVMFDLESDGLINVSAAIDGPGVRHFLGIVSSVTDHFSISPAGEVEFKR